VLFESVARPLVIAHAVVAGALVALTTHHLVWIIRSRGARRRGEPRFALLASGAFCLAFLLGCLVYPTYRVRVRAEYFDAPAARAAQLALSTEAHHLSPSSPALGPPSSPALDKVAHVFDMKEHAIALGLLCSLVLLWLSRRSDPSQIETRRLYLGLAYGACGSTWFAALVGLYVASLRAVGAP
jgi:hypothetical protein